MFSNFIHRRHHCFVLVVFTLFLCVRSAMHWPCFIFLSQRIRKLFLSHMYGMRHYYQWSSFPAHEFLFKYSTYILGLFHSYSLHMSRAQSSDTGVQKEKKNHLINTESEVYDNQLLSRKYALNNRIDDVLMKRLKLLFFNSFLSAFVWIVLFIFTSIQFFNVIQVVTI